MRSLIHIDLFWYASYWRYTDPGVAFLGQLEIFLCLDGVKIPGRCRENGLQVSVHRMCNIVPVLKLPGNSSSSIVKANHRSRKYVSVEYFDDERREHLCLTNEQWGLVTLPQPSTASLCAHDGSTGTSGPRVIRRTRLVKRIASSQFRNRLLTELTRT